MSIDEGLDEDPQATEKTTIHNDQRIQRLLGCRRSRRDFQRHDT
jgi:hypothetical protein